MWPMKRLFGLAAAVASAVYLTMLLTALLHAQSDAIGRFAAVGGGYDAAPLAHFAAQAIAHDNDQTVAIRVLPIALPSHPISITAAERHDNLLLARGPAAQIQAACVALVTTPITCQTAVVDIQVRDDASDPARLAELAANVDAIYILDGSQTIAMQVVANTPAETALAALYGGGAPFGGSGAGAAVQSRYLIAGGAPEQGLQAGRVDLWYGPTEAISRGLRFGLTSAVLDQQALAGGHIARLLQAAQRKPGQHVGLGVDVATGVVIENGRIITHTTGAYAALILDAETYGSADAATYRGPNHTLSIRDVAFHLLPEGAYGYNLALRLPIVGGITDTVAPTINGRQFDFLRPPGGSGPLLVAGDLTPFPAGTVSSRFATLAGASGEPVLVIAAGYPDDAAGPAATFWATRLVSLGVTGVQTAAITSASDLGALALQIEAAGAIWLTGDDQAIMAGQVAALQSAGVTALLRQRWQAGALLLFDHAAAAALGQWMTAESLPDDGGRYASDSFIAGYVQTAPGLNLLPTAVIEPRVLPDYRYGRLANHIYQRPDVVVFGVEPGTALEIRPSAVTVIGESAALVLDGRYGRALAAGNNGVIAATWLLLDSYSAGDVIAGQIRWHAYLPYLPNAVAQGES
jgi:cyanophycinase